jgi:single-strand DNA-binding protein
MSLNKVLLIGIVGQDPTVITTKTGLPMARFSLATHEREKSDGGQYVEITDWHEIVVVGSTAKFVLTHVKKGKHLLVEGRLKNREFTTKEGVKVRTIQVRSDRIEFVGPVAKNSKEEAEYNTPAHPTDVVLCSGPSPTLETLIEEDGV